MDAAPAAAASSSHGSSSGAVQATTDAPVAPPPESAAASTRELGPLDIGRFIQHPKVADAYREKKIDTLFEWQAAALNESGVLDGLTNLVYTAPTSGGKTLVAEVLLLRRLDEGGSQAKAIFVVPYKAIVDEKVRYFKQVLKDTGKSVAAYYGGVSKLPVPPKLNVLVCTMETADLVVQSLASQARLSELVVAVIDELHEVGGGRGCVLESLLSKLVCFRRQQQQQRCSQARNDDAANGMVSGELERRGPQLIAMSATLPNLATIGKWLDARVYKGVFRPVTLERYVVDPTGQVFDTEGLPKRALQQHEALPKSQTADAWLLELAREAVSKGRSVIIFCKSKPMCEMTAKALAIAGATIGPSSNSAEVRRAMEMACPDGATKGLMEILEGGAAFHHAGLTDEEKEVIESAYLKRQILVLAATSSLAAGVNLPVHTVVFKGLEIGLSDMLGPNQFHQMAGRAGRTGLTSDGAVYVLARNSKETNLAYELFDAEPKPAFSQIAAKDLRPEWVHPADDAAAKDSIAAAEHEAEPPGNERQPAQLMKILLNAIVSGLISRPADIDLFVASTLYCTQLRQEKHYRALHTGQATPLWSCEDVKLLFWETRHSISLLVGRRLIKCEKDVCWVALGLGRAISVSVGWAGVSAGNAMFDELNSVRRGGICLLNDVHMLYLCVPPPKYDDEWLKIWPIKWEWLDRIINGQITESRQIGELCESLLGLSCDMIPVLAQSAPGQRGRTVALEEARVKFSRLWLALLLYYVLSNRRDKLVGVFFEDLTSSFARVSLCAFRKQASTRASELTRFCAEMDAATPGEAWWQLRAMFEVARDRLWWCVSAEVLPLLSEELPSMTASLAMALHKAGYRDLTGIASSSEVHLLAALLSHGSKTSSMRQRRNSARTLLAEAREAFSRLTAERRGQLAQIEHKLGARGPCPKPKRGSGKGGKGGRGGRGGKGGRGGRAVGGGGRSSLPGPARPPRVEGRASRAAGAAPYPAREGLHRAAVAHASSSAAPMPLPVPTRPDQDVVVKPADIKLPELQQHLLWCYANAPEKAQAALEAMRLAREATEAASDGRDWRGGGRGGGVGGGRGKRDASRLGALQPAGGDSDMSLTSSSSSGESPSKSDENASPQLQPVGGLTRTKRGRGPAESGAHGGDAGAILGRVDVLVGEAGAVAPDPGGTSTGAPPSAQVSGTISLADFAAAWRAAPRFAFVLDVDSSGAGQRERRQCTRPPYLGTVVRGMAVCIEPPTVYYLPLSSTAGAAGGMGGVGGVGGAATQLDMLSQQEACCDTHAAVSQPLDDSQGSQPLGGGAATQASACHVPAGTCDGDGTQVSDGTSMPEAWSLLREVMSSPHGCKVAHNMKRQLALLLLRDVCVAGGLRDPAIAMWMLSPDEEAPPCTVRAMAAQYCPDEERALRGLRGTMRDLACKTARLSLGVMSAFEDMLAEKELLAPFEQNEMPLAPVLARMELCGFRVETDPLEAHRIAMARKETALVAEGNRLACREFNWKSSKDVGHVIFEVLKLGATKPHLRLPRKRTPKGRKGACAWQTSSAALELLTHEHPLPAMIVEHRKINWMRDGALSNLRSFRQRDWLRVADERAAAGGGDGGSGTQGQSKRLPDPFCAIHTMIRQTQACTGRLSTDEPNLQGLPHAFDFWGARRYVTDSVHDELSEALVTPTYPRDTPLLLRCPEEPGAFAHGKLLEVLSRRACDSYECADGTSDGSLASAWRARGVPYAPERAAHVVQLRVLLLALPLERCGATADGSPGGDAVVAAGAYGGGDAARAARQESRTLIYPADQAWRVHQACPIDGPGGQTWEALRPPAHARLLDAPSSAAEAGKTHVGMREAFVARPGCVLLSADYSQIEMRVVAHFSGDAQLGAALQPGGDLFRAMASRLFRVPEPQVSEQQRAQAKEVSYAILYGAGPGKLVDALALSHDEAKALIRQWHAAYPAVAQFRDDTLQRARMTGFVETLCGRKRFLPHLKSKSQKERAKAERQAFNTMCQGSAADLIKRAMLAIDKELLAAPDAEGRGGALHRADPGRLLLQVHDELVFEVVEARAPRLRALVREAMEGAAPGAMTRVPLLVKVKQGPTWGNLVEVPEGVEEEEATQ